MRLRDVFYTTAAVTWFIALFLYTMIPEMTKDCSPGSIAMPTMGQGYWCITATKWKLKE